MGDPVNAVRIFNEKEVDELLILDIDCSAENKEPNYDLIEEIVSEAFMPVGYGGGIANLGIAKKVFQLGVEKVIINSALTKNLNLLSEISAIYGAQAVVGCIDYKKSFLGVTKAYFINARQKSNATPLEWAKTIEKAGAGEIILNSVDREGGYNGFDLELLKQVVSSVNIPVVISGGASSNMDFDAAKKAGASGMAAGSMFVYHGPHKAVLINFPTQEQLKKVFK